MALFRRLALIFLALTVLVQSAESVVARSEMAGATMVAFCAEGQAAAQMIDAATGKPLAHAHDCPHCLAAASPDGLTLPALPGWTAFPGRITELSLADLALLAPRASRVLRPEARGPPLSL